MPSSLASPVDEPVASAGTSQDDDGLPDHETAPGPEAEKEAQQPPSSDAGDRDGQRSRDDAHPSPPPADVPSFDWEDFEKRYEKALQDADEREKEILREAESLSKYFQSWASAASAHDDERAIKRLRTRQRFVNMSEEKMAQKQKHYEEVVRAFERALALLKST